MALSTVLYAGGAFAATCDTTWSDGNADWNTSAGNWSSGFPTSSTNACITDGTSDVSLGGTGSTANLSLASGNILSITGTLHVSGASLSNAGMINVADGILQVNGSSLELTGTGTVTLSSGGFINQSSGGQTLENFDNSIVGTGQFGENGLAITNDSAGTIDANASANTLSLNGGGLITNAGLLEGTNGGTLAISNTVTNTGGNITANGGTVDIASAVTGGTLNGMAAVGSNLETTGGAVLNGVTVNGLLTVASGTTQLEGTITNNGTIANPDNILQVLGSSVTLQGGGTIAMTSNNFFNQNSGSQTLNNVDNLIEGAGQLGENGLAVNNESGGTVNANINGGTMSMNGGGTVTNAGLLEATNSGTLTITNTVNNSGGNITANGGTVNVNGNVNGGTLNNTGSSGSTLNASSTVLNGVTLNGTLNDTSTVQLQGTFTNNGTVVLPNSNLTIVGNVTLTGGGTVMMQSDAFFDQNSGSQTLENVNNLIEGTGQLGQNGMAITNDSAGVVNANLSTGTLSMNGGGAVSNAGLLEATTSGTLSITDTVTNTGNGAITADGGTVSLDATINNGTLNNTGSAGSALNASGTKLNGVTLNGTLNDTGTVQLQGTFTNNGTVLLPNSNLTIVGNVTLTGSGTVMMQSDAFFNQNSGSQTLENVNNLIEGTGQLGQNGMAFTNDSAGVVNANLSTGTLSMNGGGAVSNAGLLEATDGGTLSITDTVTNTGNGAITADGGTVSLDTTINNGTLNNTGSAGSAINASGTTLNGVTLNGTLNDTGTVQLKGTFTNNGTVVVPDTNLTIIGDVSLTGGGTVMMSSNAFFNQNSGGQTLTNVNNTIEGTGELGQNGMAVNNEAAGLVNANVNGGTLSMNGGGTVTNTGTLEASNGGTLTVSSPVATSTYSAGTLTGNYIVDGSAHTSTLQINALGNSVLGEVTTLGDGTTPSSITLNGTNASTLFHDTGGNNALTPLNTVTANAALTVENGYAMIAPPLSAFTNNGTVTVGNPSGTDAASSFTTVGGFAGAGTLKINPNGTVTIGAASAVGTLIQNGTGAASLAIGSNNVTVSSDYQNANFGVGNSFDKHANVSGSGLILASGNVGMSVSGADITNGTTTSPTLNLGNFHTNAGGSTTFTVNNTGTTGPVLRGAVQNSGIGSSLSLTAQNFGPIALGGSSAAQTITYNPTGAGSLSGQTFKVVSNFDNVATQTVAVTGAAYDLANPNVTPTVINFGNVHLNATPAQQAITVANNTISNAAFQEGLDASFGTLGTGIVTNGGSIINQAAGTSNNSAMTVGINTTTAGAINATATVNLTSDGSTTSHLANTTLASQSVMVTGGVYNLASSNTIAPVNFGVVHTGDGGGSLTDALTITNTAPTGAFSEGLNSSFGAFSGTGGSQITTNGSITNLLAGSSSTAMTVTLNTATAGNVSGTIAVNQASNGTIDGLSNTSLGTQNVGVSASFSVTLTNEAVVQINNTQPITFANARQGTTVPTVGVSVTNAAPSSAFTEGLLGNVTGTSGTGITATGGFGGTNASPNLATEVAGQATNSTSIQVGIDTSTAGAKSGNAMIDFASDGTPFGGVVTDLGNTNVAVSGNVYRLSSPTLNTTAVTLAARAGTTSPTANVSITNTSPDAFTEGLAAQFSSATPATGFTTSGSITNLAAQGNDASSLKIGLNTGTAGTFTGGTATVDFTSNGLIDNATAVSVGSGTVDLTGKVYTPAIVNQETTAVDYGIVHVGDGSGSLATNVVVQNSATTTALNDTLTGGIGATNSTGAAFSASGTLGSGLTAGSTSTNQLQVSLNTGTAGSYTGTANLSLSSHDPDLADLGLSSSAIALNAQVNNYAQLVFSKASGAGSVAGSGNAFTLNFGDLLQGSGLSSAELNFLNCPGCDPDFTDTLTSFITSMSDTDFGLGGDSVTDLAGDGTQGGFDVDFDATSLGFEEEILTFEVDSDNADADTVLTPVTLTLEANVVSTTAAVPEPGTLALLGPAFGMLFVAFRRRKSRARG